MEEVPHLIIIPVFKEKVRFFFTDYLVFVGKYIYRKIIISDGNLLESLAGGTNYSSQNLYVQPPTRGSMHPHQSSLIEDKSNLLPRGRSRVPLPDHVSLSQLDRPSTPPGPGAGPSVGSPPGSAGPAGLNHTRSRSGIDDPDGLSPPRPPPPRTEGEGYGKETF